MGERPTVAITGASGTVGREVVRLLEDDERVGRIIATARLPRDPATLGWKRTTLEIADVREADAVARVLSGADVVVHAAFAIYGGRRNEIDLRAINIGGSLNVARAAVAEGARRFVYLSSVAAYGLLPDNPQPLSEDDPVRATPHHFYAAQKAAVEPQVRSVLEQAGVESYVLRPCGIAGPHAAGAALDPRPEPTRRGARGLLGA